MADAASASGATSSSVGEFKRMRLVPIEKEEFVCKIDQKKGWSNWRLCDKDKEFLAESWERENLEGNGALRQWNPKKKAIL